MEGWVDRRLVLGYRVVLEFLVLGVGLNGRWWGIW